MVPWLILPLLLQIDAKFNVWVLIAPKDERKLPLPEIGDDPNVTTLFNLSIFSFSELL